MTSQTLFILAAALLVLITLSILLPPLWRAPRKDHTVDRQAANVAIFRQQLAELERDCDAGTLAPADFEQAKTELQRRLLEEADPQAAPREKAGGRKTAFALLVALPLAAGAAYLALGQPQALSPAQARVSPQQIDAMLAKLADRLRENPADSKGWIILARSYKALGRYPEAAEAFARGSELVDNDAVLLADFAEVLGQTHGGSLIGKPSELIARALKIDPSEPQALFLAGSEATERGDLAAIADYWGRLLLQLEPGSEEAQSLQEAVDKASQMLADAKPGGAEKPGPRATAKAPASTAADQLGKPGKDGAASREAVSGEVVLSGKIAAQTRPDELIFIFARADEGSRMPLAVQRAQVADLPLSFRFDDSMALPSGRKISEFTTLSIEARIAKAGMAKSSSGDLFGTVKGVKPGSRDVKVVIDQIQP